MMKAEIEAALTSGVNTRQGTVVVAAGGLAGVMREAGLIGEGNGLTRRGSILAERLRAEALDRAFG